ncbi:hypothetical protein C0J52_08555 [Blattella germanica]|nr:hypothetical protein C0J52_08555 [Blattella germanica]
MNSLLAFEFYEIQALPYKATKMILSISEFGFEDVTESAEASNPLREPRGTVWVMSCLPGQAAVEVLVRKAVISCYAVYRLCHRGCEYRVPSAETASLLCHLLSLLCCASLVKCSRLPSGLFCRTPHDIVEAPRIKTARCRHEQCRIVTTEAVERYEAHNPGIVVR